MRNVCVKILTIGMIVLAASPAFAQQQGRAAAAAAAAALAAAKRRPLPNSWAWKRCRKS